MGYLPSRQAVAVIGVLPDGGRGVLWRWAGGIAKVVKIVGVEKARLSPPIHPDDLPNPSLAVVKIVGVRRGCGCHYVVRLSGRDVDVVHMVGGGSRSECLR